MDIATKRLNSLQCYIFPIRDGSLIKNWNVYNNSYRLWKSVWKEEFERINFNSQFLIDDLLRQDNMIVLANEKETASVVLASRLSLKSEACLEHRYIKSNYPKRFLDKIKDRGADEIMTWEYLTVSHHWRKSLVGISLARVMMSLAAKFLASNEIAKCAIAPARNDYGVSDMVYAIGGEPILKNVTNHNVSCDLTACFKENV